MNLIPIVYSSLLIVVGFFIIVLVVSYIAHKFRSEKPEIKKVYNDIPKPAAQLYVITNKPQGIVRRDEEKKLPVPESRIIRDKQKKYNVVRGTEENNEYNIPRSYSKSNFEFSGSEKRYSLVGNGSHSRYKRISTDYESSVDYGFNRNSLTISNLRDFSDNQLLSFYSEK